MCHYVSVTSHVVACAWVIHTFSTFPCLSCDHCSAPKRQWHVHVCHMYNVTGVLHDTAAFRNVEKWKYTKVKNRPKSKNSQWEPSKGERMIFIQGGLFTLKGFFNICPCKSTVWEVCPVVIRFVLCRRHTSLPVEVNENPGRLVSAGCRRVVPCRKWKSASFGYSKILS